MTAPMHIEHVNVGALKPYARNARTHSRKQLNQIATSIRKFGFTNPVLVSDDREIIAGHGRVEAAKLLGLDQVPTIRLSHLSEAQRRAYGSRTTSSRSMPAGTRRPLRSSSVARSWRHSQLGALDDL